jgi:hypothetical protein
MTCQINSMPVFITALNQEWYKMWCFVEDLTGSPFSSRLTRLRPPSSHSPNEA